ncbi:substrate-binding periplasmic protein [Shewanella maritima]|uniref:substrate-binding periplasmic protein n=1 Tax=Shewanella maritima TaxID=2520507 RepID=UPI0013EEBB46|nr:transporter substrate-binding domain-containing protein [Shewanella maritima]
MLLNAKAVRDLVLASLLTLVSLSAAAQQVNLTSGEWPPYTSESIYQNGFAAEVVRQAYQAVGIKVHIGHFPWKRSYHYAETGTGLGGDVWHGSIAWVKTPERETLFHYSTPLLSDNMVLYSLKKAPIEWTTLTDLAGLTIGATEHTNYEILESAQNKGLIKLQRAGNYDILFQRLLAERIDAVPQLKSVGEFYLSNNVKGADKDKITRSDSILSTREFHLILNKANPNNKQFAADFDRGLAIIKQNGVYQDLINKLNRGRYNN